MNEAQQKRARQFNRSKMSAQRMPLMNVPPSNNLNTPGPQRRIMSTRKLTSKTLVEKVVEQTFGEKNKEVIFKKYEILQNINQVDVEAARGNKILKQTQAETE